MGAICSAPASRVASAPGIAAAIRWIMGAAGGGPFSVPIKKVGTSIPEKSSPRQVIAGYQRRFFDNLRNHGHQLDARPVG